MGCNCNCCVPNKFLYCYPLKLGAFVVGIYMAIFTLLCTIAVIIQTALMRGCTDCKAPIQYPLNLTYSIHVLACLAGVVMTLVHLWLLWGVKKDKIAVLVGWLVITIFWAVQSLAIAINYLILMIEAPDIHVIIWSIGLMFLLIVFGITFYGIIVVYAYYLELKELKRAASVVSGTNH